MDTDTVWVMARESLKVQINLLAAIHHLSNCVPQFMEKTPEERHAYTMIMMSTLGDWLPSPHVPVVKKSMQEATAHCHLADGNVYFYVSRGQVRLYDPHNVPLDPEEGSITINKSGMWVNAEKTAEAFTLESLFVNP
jgi:hypothetical protein